MKNVLSVQIFAETAEADAAAGEETTENAVPESGEEPSEPTDTAEAEEQAAEAPEGKNASENGLNALKAAAETLAELKKRARVNEVVASWEKEAEALKETYPSFELSSEMKNGEFRSLLGAGVPLRRAYETVNLENIIGTAMRYAAVNAGKNAARTLARQNARPQENGVLDRASSVKQTDVASLTEKDIRRILGEVSRGAKITFG